MMPKMLACTKGWLMISLTEGGTLEENMVHLKAKCKVAQNFFNSLME